MNGEQWDEGGWIMRTFAVVVENLGDIFSLELALKL
jgi:hypothetical protein